MRLLCPRDFPTQILDWVAISFPREFSQPRDGTCVSCIGRQILYLWAIWEALVSVFSSVRFSRSVMSEILCDPMDCSTPGLPVHPQLPELAQIQVHRVSDAIQPSHPLSSPSPPTFNLSQHQGLFQWVGSSHRVAKVLEFQLQHQSFCGAAELFDVLWLVDI